MRCQRMAASSPAYEGPIRLHSMECVRIHRNRVYHTTQDDGHMKLYDVANSDVVGTLSGHSSWVLSVSFSGDGRSFTSSSSDKSVKIWNVAERQCLHTFNDHQDQVWGVKYSPDSSKVISVSEDRSVNLYDCPPNVS
uniref:WD repeat-containing protein 61 n=1 Tax=Culex pipiens TaxID=7175 RepID=A0A8D8A3I5_CULPI